MVKNEYEKLHTTTRNFWQTTQYWGLNNMYILFQYDMIINLHLCVFKSSDTKSYLQPTSVHLQNGVKPNYRPKQMRWSMAQQCTLNRYDGTAHARARHTANCFDTWSNRPRLSLPHVEPSLHVEPVIPYATVCAAHAQTIELSPQVTFAKCLLKFQCDKCDMHVCTILICFWDGHKKAN